MQKYKSNITTTSGAAVRNVPVTVLKEGGAPAALFLDRDGHVAAPNPLKTGADGTFSFYAANGRYSLRTTVDGVTISDDDVVLLADPVELAQVGPIAEAIAAGGGASADAALVSHTVNTSNPHGVTKVQVGLGDVNNTSDANKPVSTAQAAAIAARYGKDNVLGTVSQSAGVPTGAVIERGSNANGEYVRFADGTQICTIQSTFTPAADVVWSYPATFAADPNYLSASANHYDPRYYLVSTQMTGGGTSATIYRSVRFTHAAVADPFILSCVAIGRWF